MLIVGSCGDILRVDGEIVIGELLCFAFMRWDPRPTLVVGFLYLQGILVSVQNLNAEIHFAHQVVADRQSDPVLSVLRAKLHELMASILQFDIQDDICVNNTSFWQVCSKLHLVQGLPSRTT